MEAAARVEEVRKAAEAVMDVAVAELRSEAAGGVREVEE